MGDLKMTNSFLYIPEVPIPLLGWDLTCKLNAQVTFSPEKQQLHLQVPWEHAQQLQMLLACPEEKKDTTPSEIYKTVSLGWWDTWKGCQSNDLFVKIKLKEGAIIPHQKQYSFSKDTLDDIQPILQKFLKHNLIQPCRSLYNTPICVLTNHILMNIRLYRT